MTNTILILLVAAIAQSSALPKVGAFTHPGIPPTNTNTDLAAAKTRLAAGEQPWKACHDMVANLNLAHVVLQPGKRFHRQGLMS